MFNQQSLRYWLVLRRILGMGGRRFAALLEGEKCPADYFNGEQPKKELINWLVSNRIQFSSLDWKGVEQDLKWATQHNHTILTWEDSRYPSLLKEIPASPPVLFVKGSLSGLYQSQLAMVGSRFPTKEGLRNAFQFSSALVEGGWGITSGLALGIDAASHEGALSAQGTTLAILGNSLDSVYPPQNIDLAERICSNGGALISEFPLGSPPMAQHFPQRNRIISGLSVGVIVVESALKSGSLITAQYALEQGKEVYALPGSIHNPLAKGCHQIIRQGAKCVDSVEHILEELPAQSHPVSFKKEGNTPNKAMLNPIAASLVKWVGNTCTSTDELVSKTGLTAAMVSSMLLKLEIENVITAVPGGYKVTHDRKEERKGQ